jgi:putative serine/threonine protein kinase
MRIPLKNLQEKKYAQILCYPKYDLNQLTKRLEELEGLGVKALEFSGESRVFNVPVLGKGCVGVVVTAHTDQGKAALKIRRVDADRAEMQHEAEMLRKANSIEVGPSLFGVTGNFLLMEFIDGTLLPKWVKLASGKGMGLKIRKVLRSILEQCWRLDEDGLDHGELSTAPKHVLVRVNDKPCLVDFETASVNRRVSNVTSICQYLFLGSHFSEMIKDKLGKISKSHLLEILRNYKRGRTRESFENILDICKLRKV